MGDRLLALLAQPGDDPLRMFLRPLPVIGIVQQAGDGPLLRVVIRSAVPRRRPPHDVLDRLDVPPQVRRLDPFVHLGERGGAVHGSAPGSGSI